ncbi:hypothetical protein [Burkholderia ubonensis]|uniref:hypothetical protein n=1 Tax=Burkholderia ubonensis TaxID=101571 RepID=UPI0007538025|nr:hypothetical protein [Burkholderia ubonensis]KVT01161.1 hypothetical protein WK47_25135 [Burkholderia ubonensis]KVT33816.1 hypothetical protein WK50_02510 [Burkholderia ubonensis]
MALSDQERMILAILGTEGGYTTGQVAERVAFQVSSNRRTQSAAVRGMLLLLEAQGLVARMDDAKPVCWIKVGRGRK